MAVSKKAGDGIYLYDTCSLLRLQEDAFREPFAISERTLRELEEIKTSGKKDEHTRWLARKLVRQLDEGFGKDVYSVLTLPPQLVKKAENYPGAENDYVIAMTAQYAHLPLYTDDLSCRLLARSLGCEVARPEAREARYMGYKMLRLTDHEMADFYSAMDVNVFGLLRNEYYIIENEQGAVVDKGRWNGEKHVPLYDRGIKTVTFDKIKPRDAYQQMAIDSIMNNTLTILTGKPGSGKTLMSLAAIFYLIEKGNYDRVIVFTNPCKVRGATDMGFYTGDAVKKAMQNSIGHILVSKLGDRYIVDQMLAQEKLKIVSVADCRGMEIKDNEILFMSEAQNLSVEMVKLLLSRASSKCKVVLEGDDEAQVDSPYFEGNQNGLRRAIEAAKGEEIFGHVYLPNIWRSKLAELADKI